MTQTAGDPLTTALALHQGGHLEQAESLYRQILAQNPRCADAWHLFGALCLQSDRWAEAVEHITRAIAINPINPDYYSHLGAAYGNLAQHDEAISVLRRAVQIAPRSATAHYNLGTALRNAGRFEEAVTSFRHAIAADPDGAEAHYNLANALRELNRFEEAEASYRDALRVRPRYLKAVINLGTVLRDRNRLDESIEVLRGAVAISPDYANAHLNLGTALRDAGHYDEAVGCFHRALSLEPGSAEARNNLGTTLQARGRFDEALACYEEALRCDPDAADAHFNRATHLLRRGDFVAGFAEYEWRWKCKSYSNRQFGKPRWDGSELAGRTILLHAEQGLGDTLQFIRYAIHVKNRGGRVIVECQAALVKILEGCPGIDQLIVVGSPLPPFDVELPLLSLPRILNWSKENLPVAAEISLDAPRVETWREALARFRGFRVGVCWQGNPKFLFDRQRSFALDEFAPLAEIEGVRLISLQKGSGADQLRKRAGFEVIDLGPQFDEAAGPFVDTAAVMKNLDLVVSSDTAVAHLAGALRVPVWVALSNNSDWRWLAAGTETIWYPTMRLFRQQKSGEWRAVFNHMAAELRKKIAAAPSPTGRGPG